MDIALEKARLRRDALARRAARAPEEVARVSAAIMRHLETCPDFQNARAVLTYVSLPGEIDTRGMIQRLLEQDRVVFVPACRDAGELEWCRLAHWEELAPGRHGVLEPRNPQPVAAQQLADTICLVPGLLFDRAGHRCGYGGGYFDRFLACYSGVSIGLVPAVFLVNKLPREPHDRAVNAVVTEDGVSRPNKGPGSIRPKGGHG